MPLEPKIVAGFLNPRERVVVANLARKGGFTAGRQATGYEKRDIVDDLMAERLIKRALKELGEPVLFDAWVLRYPIGSEIPAHTDPPVEGMCHVRLNALALGCEGGVLYVDGAEIPLESGDAYVFRPDLMKHMVTKVERNERLMFSVGANVDRAHALKLGMA